MSKQRLEFENNANIALESLSMVTIENELAGLNAAFEEVIKLVKIKNIVKANETISAETAKLVKISLENTKKTLNLVIPEDISLEGVEDLKTYCMEGLSGFLERMWLAIKNTFKWIWDKITWLFRGTANKAEAKVKEIEIEKLKKEIKELLKNKSTNTKTALERPYIEIQKYLEPFNYKNCNYKSTMLIKDVREMKNKLNVIKEFVHKIELDLNSIHEAISQSVEHTGFTVPDGVLFSNMRIYIDGLNLKPDNKYRTKMNEHLVSDEIKDNSLNVINDLSNNGFIAFYLNNHSEIKIKIIRNIKDDNEKVQIQILDLADLDSYIISSVDSYGEAIDLYEVVEHKMTAIQRTSEKTLEDIHKILIELNESGETEKYRSTTEAITKSFLRLQEITLLAGHGVNYLKDSTNDYIELAKYMIKYWKTEN